MGDFNRNVPKCCSVREQPLETINPPLFLANSINDTNDWYRTRAMIDTPGKFAQYPAALALGLSVLRRVYCRVGVRRIRKRSRRVPNMSIPSRAAAEVVEYVRIHTPSLTPPRLSQLLTDTEDRRRVFTPDKSSSKRVSRFYPTRWSYLDRRAWLRIETPETFDPSPSLVSRYLVLNFLVSYIYISLDRKRILFSSADAIEKRMVRAR